MKMPRERSLPLVARIVWALVVPAIFAALVGCSREHYRQQADQEVYSLLECGSQDSRWELDDYRLQADPQSRFYDPNSLVCPPMPPDDPVSHQLMHCVDCKKGWPHWHKNGDTPYVENPAWRTLLPFDANGHITLDREGAVLTALVQSRDYQRQLENLYLSALDVTFQRFRLDTQFFGGNSTFFVARNTRSTLSTDTDFEIRRLFATGATLVVDTANSVVWQFSGPDSYTLTTGLNVALLQPLLRGAGRDVVLEGLTDSERALLANIRQMARYRQGFYAVIVAGRAGIPGPSVAGVGIPTAGGGTSGIGGLLGLLQSQVEIRNQEFQVDALRDSFRRSEAVFETGQGTDRSAVDRIKQSLLSGQSRLLQQKADYQTRLDTYKIVLGLPPDLPVTIKDPVVDRFYLIDPSLSDLQDDAEATLDVLRDPQQPIPEDLLARLTEIQQQSADQLKSVEQDVQKYIDALPKRRENLEAISSREEFQRGEVEMDAGSAQLLEDRVQILQKDFAELGQQLEKALGALEALVRDLGKADAGPEKTREMLRPAMEALSGHLLRLSLAQAWARLDAITLTPVDITPEEALRIARVNRLDWMNAHAALVDIWRQVQVVANSLRGVFNVRVEGDISRTESNRANLRGDSRGLRVGFDFDAPLTRLEERNRFRTAIINYERARRDYYAYEDAVSAALRDLIRNIRFRQIDIEVQRQAVFVAITRVDLARLALQRPPRTAQEVTSARQTSTLAQDVVDSLTSLLGAQNAFLRVWLDYEIQRMNLDLDMGTMKLDDRGLWIDPGPITSKDAEGVEEPEAIPPGVEEAFPDLDMKQLDPSKSLRKADPLQGALREDRTQQTEPPQPPVPPAPPVPALPPKP